MNFFNCIVAATDKPSAFGWTGFALGAAFGVYLMFFAPWLRFQNLALDKAVGRLLLVASVFIGLTLGEVVRVIWSGQCSLP